MKLVQIARLAWQVLAICDDRGDCQVLDFLEDMDSESLSTRMHSLLAGNVSQNGPPKNENISKHLNDGIHEFKRGPKTGKKLRVLWFYDKNRVVVCTNAFTKGERKTPPGMIEQAKKDKEEDE